MGEELKQAKEIAELKEAGLTHDEIGDRLGISKATVSRRLDQWNRFIGLEKENDEDRLESAQNIMSTVRGILSDMKIAEKLGEITGADIGTIERTLDRIINKKATKGEVHKILANIGGVIRGFIESREYHKTLNLPDREPLVDVEKLKKEIKTEIKKELAVAAGTSGESKQEESKPKEGEKAKPKEEKKESEEKG